MKYRANLLGIVAATLLVLNPVLAEATKPRDMVTTGMQAPCNDITDSAGSGKTVGEGLEQRTGLSSNFIAQWLGGLFGRVLAQKYVDRTGTHHDLSGCASAGVYLAKDLLGKPENASVLVRAGLDVAPMLVQVVKVTKKDYCTAAFMFQQAGSPAQGSSDQGLHEGLHLRRLIRKTFVASRRVTSIFFPYWFTFSENGKTQVSA